MASFLKLLAILLVVVCLRAPFSYGRAYFDRTSSFEFQEHDSSSEKTVNIKSCLRRINGYRALHDAKPLEWDPYAEKHAREWAEILIASGGKLESDLQGKYGEREGELLYRGTSCEEAVDAWYSEIGKYRASGACEKPPSVAPKGTEDFAQLVWRSSQRVGVVIIGDVIVARFHPRGNFVDEYADDVKC